MRKFFDKHVAVKKLACYWDRITEFKDIRRFIYAGDLCLAAQAEDFRTVEKILTKALESLSEYYEQNSLNTNPSKTQVCAFLDQP